MNLRDIQYFAVVAEHGNVSRASEALNLSPPALSKSLRRLEAAMGAKLVRRMPKGVELTTVGAALLTHVARIRVTLDDVAREAADLSLGRAGHLRIGAGPTVCDELTDVYGPLIADSAKKITIQIVVNDNDVTLPMLMKGDLDLVFNFIPPAMEPSLKQEQLFFDSWVVCASESHRLVGKRRLSIGDLVGERWALTPGILSKQWLARAFLERGLAPPKIAVETRSLSMRLRTWATSDLLGFGPRRVLNGSSTTPGLRELPIKELTWPRSVGVLTRKDAYLSPAARRFLDLLRTHTSNG